MRILYPVSIDSFLAQAGQSVVERALLAGLLARGARVRLVTFGSPAAQERIAREHAAAGLELVRGEDATSADVLAGVDALLLHSLPLDDVWAWLDRVRPQDAVPVVQYVHSLLLAPFEQVMWAELWRRWNGRPSARLVAPSERTAARARTLAHETERRGGRLPPVVVIPHGVAPLGGCGRAEARARLGLDDGDLVVLSVGRITAQKAAYTQLVLAFHAAARRLAEPRRAVLLLAGSVSEHDKPYLALVERQARRLGSADRVRVVENFDASEKALLYAAGNVFVSLANDPQESFGLALLEAMRAELPVLATDWDGYPEALPAAYGPRLVPTLASHALARTLHWSAASEACAPAFTVTAGALGRLLADAPLRAALGDEGARFAADRGWEPAVDALLRLLERLRAEPHAPETVAPPPARSMVDGLASGYLDDDPRLRIAPAGAGPRARRQALWIAARPPSLPLVPADERPAWLASELKRGRRQVLRAATAAGADGLPASALRARAGLPVAEGDLLLLRLLRFGLLEAAVSRRA